MLLIKCDRCLRSFPVKSKAKIGVIEITVIDPADPDPDKNKIGGDLCEECLNELDTWMNAVPDNEAETPETQAQPEPVETAVKKPGKKPGKPSILDKDKMQALRNAGWPLSKIAEEMHCHLTTVSKMTTAPEKTEKKRRPLEWAESEPDLAPILEATGL